MAAKKQIRQTKDVQAQSKVEQILINDMEISAKADALLAETRQMNASFASALDSLARSNRASERAGAQGEAVYAAITEEVKALKRELRYMAIQSASIFEGLTEKINEITSLLNKDGSKPAATPASAEEPKPAPVQIDYDLLADKVAERTAAKTPAVQAEEKEAIDYDLLASKVAERTAESTPRYPATYPVTYKSEANIDADALADKIISRMPAPVAQDGKTAAAVIAAPAASPDIDYDTLARKVAALIPPASAQVGDIVVNTDEIADRVVARLPFPETVSPDYIANRVAEQIVVPTSAGEAEIDYNALAAAVASRLNIPAAKAEVDGDYIASQVSDKLNVGGLDNEIIAKKVAEYLINKPASAQNAADGTVSAEDPQTVSININVSGLDNAYIADRVVESIDVPDYQEIMFDYDYLATKIAEKAGTVVSSKPAAAAVVAETVDYNINEGELADAIALRVGSLKAEDFEILVDDEGCTSLSKEICKRLDYEHIANSVADKLREVFVEEDGDETDYEEMAAKISEKITVAGINEDAIAEKAAAVLSNYLPDFDTDDVADKVVEQIISALPAPDAEEISKSVADKLAEYQQENDYEIVLDEDGLDKISDSVTVKVLETASERFEAIDKEISEIKDMLGTEPETTEEVTEETQELTDDRYEELRSDIAEIKEMLGAEPETAEGEVTEEVTDERLEILCRDVAEIKEMLENGVLLAGREAADESAFTEAYVTEETLVTVSDLIEGISTEDAEEPEEVTEILAAEEPVEEVVEEVKEEPEEEPAEEAIGEEIDEEPEEVLEQLVDKPEGEPLEELAEEPAEVIKEEVKEEPVEEVIEEVKEEPAEEVIVEEVKEEPAEEVIEEVKEEPVEEVVEEVKEEPVIVPVVIAAGADEPEEDETDDADDAEEEELPEGGVDFANMMRFNRSFIARIIQSTDDQKKYYGEVRNALLSYRKVNSNIAWGAERFHKGRETIARFKIRGKTLVLYLALDPAEHEFSVYHHKDVSDNKSVAGTPMMVKIKSPRGVKKAIRLIDEMLAMRDGIKRPVPERDYAAMYPYESMEELIEDGLVKDVKRNKFNMDWK